MSAQATYRPSNLIAAELAPSDGFIHRHIGPEPADISAMLETIGAASLDELIEQTIPASIRLPGALGLDEPRGESEALRELRAIAAKNKVLKSCIGQGYYDCIIPPVILRNILENPGWYTQYTPYQAEIAQGRLEALLNFQTMVADLTGLPLANASLLDEATAAAEAMAMCHAIVEKKGKFLIDRNCHPQTIAVVRTRAESMGIDLAVDEIKAAREIPEDIFGVLVQYPGTDGRMEDYSELAKQIHAQGGLLVVATDLLALTLIKSPGEFGADIAIGCSQRFGVPMGFGGPHAAFMATKNEYARKLPGRIVGVSKDAAGNRALRLAIQTREQHIRREKATSNICTAQVLLAVMASMYAVYHGPDGLRRIARRTHAMAGAIWAGLQRLGHDVGDKPFFDTLRVKPNGLDQSAIIRSAELRGYNFRAYPDGSIGIAVDETTTRADVEIILESFAGGSTFRLNCDELATAALNDPRGQIENRNSPFLTHLVFESYHSETEMLRYINRLQSRDLSLTHSMIALGSCTMKLNATSEMIPVTWPEFANIHPLAPADQTRGYAEMFSQLESWFAAVTGLPGVSLQPNAGSQGEYAGLLAIRRSHHSRNQSNRTICLIPTSAHGTNPASAVIAGFQVVPVACDANGNVDLDDLRAKAEQHKDNLACLMLTYPSTHGVFEEQVREICGIVHEFGGQVYMDGANMNAQVGLTSPAAIGADVCHLNLHKTFCIPHGGGGPGMGPIAVAEHLREFLPGNPFENSHGAVSAAPFGSAAILPISWMYIRMMGAIGLKRATQTAILNANYMMAKLEPHYSVLFKGTRSRVAHEFILDCRSFEKTAGVKVEDIAKRLMDYGFHAPTMSFPVPGTLMIEPTESESKAELDRFCDALIKIRQEIRDIEDGKQSREDNPLKHAPHTAAAIASDNWSHAYSREQAAYPVAWLREHKFWPFVSRIDNPYGDRNLICTCPPVEEFAR